MSRTPVDYRQVGRDTYKRFLLAYPDLKISFDQYKEIIYAFNYKFRDRILETGDLITYPFGIGSFSINKKKKKKTKTFKGKEYINLAIDWQKTKKAGKRMYHFNAHSDGYSFRWFWSRSTSRFQLSEIYNFKPSRKSSRTLNEFIVKPNSDYKEKYKQYSKK